MKNWAGNYEYSTSNVYTPETLEQVQEYVKRHPKLKVLGSRHSFNGIADSTENLLSLEHLDSLINIDSTNQQVSISANINYGTLSRVLHREGFALHNLGSLPHISVVGACATATHGSGDRNRNLAAAVASIQLVTASGDLMTLSRGQEWFDGAVVSLGGIGVVVGLTLDLLPTFEVRQYVYEHLPVAQLEAHFDAITASGYSVSLFTDWNPDTVNQVWVKNPHHEAQPEFFGALMATQQLHPVAGISADPCTLQLGIPGPWNERLPHFRFEAIPSVGDELQAEYFVAREDAVEAMRVIRAIGHEIAPHLFISEIRTIAADTFWMSPCYRQDSVAIHFTFRPHTEAVNRLLPLIESRLMPFNPRPHWGKLFTMQPPKHPQFVEMLQQLDPNGKFQNAFLSAVMS